jgi:hypothetical protein
MIPDKNPKPPDVAAITVILDDQIESFSKLGIRNP